MDLRIMTEPQLGASYDDLLTIAQATEKLGFDAFIRSDHYLTTDDSTDGLPGPTDAWTTLAGLARETSTIRLGTLVSSVTYRNPGILAIQVAQVDQMSGGRVELGLGTGWFRREHEAYGIPFPQKRFDLLEEQLAIVTGLWGTPLGTAFDFEGEHYSLRDCPALPKPAQSSIPVIIGGAGASRTPRLAARYASEFNLPFVQLEKVRPGFDRVREACLAIERDPDELVYSLALATAVGADETEITRRAARLGRDTEWIRGNGLGGTASEAVDRIGALRDDGVDRLYLQIYDLHDLDHLDFIAREVVPQL